MKKAQNDTMTRVMSNWILSVYGQTESEDVPGLNREFAFLDLDQNMSPLEKSIRRNVVAAVAEARGLGIMYNNADFKSLKEQFLAGQADL